ncbi:hypothetical protein Tco_0880331 [Tanacetum coccineum]
MDLHLTRWSLILHLLILLLCPHLGRSLTLSSIDKKIKLKMAESQAENHPTSTAKEIWDNVEMLMQGSGRTIQQRKEDLFDEYERFRAIGNESIHDYFVRFHKLVNDMKITQLEIPTHQMNTKFVNNLPAYWGKYVTNVKQNMDISTTPYVQIISHLKAYEPHGVFPKQFPTNQQSDSGPSLQLKDSCYGGMWHIDTRTNSRRKAPGNVGNTGARGKKVDRLDEGRQCCCRFPMANLSSTMQPTVNSMRSKGRTVADSIAARLTRPTAYKFKTDCSIIPVWYSKSLASITHLIFVLFHLTSSFEGEIDTF